ncbi:MAG: hypothetical protein AAGI38_09450 [Bacteroidota bacterium]
MTLFTLPRIRIFEWEDLPGFPDLIRSGSTDFLRFAMIQLGVYTPVIPMVNEMLSRSGTNKITDLCSGGGGPLPGLYSHFHSPTGAPVEVLLTDKFPNQEAGVYLKNQHEKLRYESSSVDVTSPDMTFPGVTTMFSSIHHFTEEEVRQILANAQASGQPIGIFEGAKRGWAPLLGAILAIPLMVWALTPFIRPLRGWRLFFTYLIPAIPLMTWWDGTASVLKMYRAEELLALAKEDEAYEWKSGYLKNSLGMELTYLVGWPKEIQNIEQ